MYASCNKCNYRTGKHWSLKGIMRELKKTRTMAIVPNMCPECGKINSLKIREEKKIG